MKISTLCFVCVLFSSWIAISLAQESEPTKEQEAKPVNGRQAEPTEEQEDFVEREVMRHVDPDTLKVLPISEEERKERIQRREKRIQRASQTAWPVDPHYSDRFPKAAAAPAVVAKSTGTVVDANSISITIANTNNAGSEVDYIFLTFNPDKRLRLYGRVKSITWIPNPHQPGDWIDIVDYYFPKNTTIEWDLSRPSYRPFLQSVHQDDWDQLSVRTNSMDGIKISDVTIFHSDEKILDWSPNAWLDKPNYTYLGFAERITATKLSDLNNPTNQVVYSGLLELGKTNGYKYGTGGLWCSEFASWCLRKGGWDTPTESIGTDNLENFFAAAGRLYTRDDVIKRVYIPKAGDYFSINGGDHSVIFSHWQGGVVPATITGDTKFRTIEGNSNQAVHTRTRSVSQIYRVGKSQ